MKIENWNQARVLAATCTSRTSFSQSKPAAVSIVSLINIQCRKFSTSALVRNSSAHSQTWHSALCGEALDWSDFTNAKTCKEVSLWPVSIDELQPWIIICLQIMIRNQVLYIYVYIYYTYMIYIYIYIIYNVQPLLDEKLIFGLTSSPQFGQAPLSAAKSFLHKPWSTLTVIKRNISETSLRNWQYICLLVAQCS